jgi:hypothetical protein
MAAPQVVLPLVLFIGFIRLRRLERWRCVLDSAAVAAPNVDVFRIPRTNLGVVERYQFFSRIPISNWRTSGLVHFKVSSQPQILMGQGKDYCPYDDLGIDQSACDPVRNVPSERYAASGCEMIRTSNS